MLFAMTACVEAYQGKMQTCIGEQSYDSQGIRQDSDCVSSSDASTPALLGIASSEE